MKSWKPTNGRFPAIIIAIVLSEQSFVLYLSIHFFRLVSVNSTLQLLSDNKTNSLVNHLLCWNAEEISS